ncbi:unnamed protein product [Cyclocybe aegerita]|uniref:F-box domain-containing protein n=1 Tax=Cyclocybe aegerita TaxID=1973307 RepID=A0A8S0VZC4_CYCAE|nr:unnamed protein product [Cyclocybe aegerita]
MSAQTSTSTSNQRMCLPPEIWHYVGQYIPLEDLKRLYGVNLLFFDLSMDAMYRSIVFGNINDLKIHQLDSLKDPKIACRVRSLSIPVNVERNHYEKQEAAPRPPSSFEKAFRRLFRRTRQVKPDPKQVERAAIAEMIAQVIPLMPNVERYTLSWSACSDPLPPYHEVAWRTFSPNLVDIALTVNTALAPHIGILSSFKFPRLESLSIQIDEDFKGPPTPWMKLVECQKTLASFVSPSRSTLKKLRMRSSLLPLAELYSPLPEFENLVVLGVEMTVHMEAGDARSFPILVIGKQASHLEELDIRIGGDDDVRPIIQSFPCFCMKDLRIPKLTTLTISAQLLNTLEHEQQIATFFRIHSSTLRILHIRGLWLASNSVAHPGLATVLDNSRALTTLSLVSEYLQASHLGLLASSLPQLERLTLNIEYVLSNTGSDAASPSDIFPKWHEVTDYMHPFVDDIKQDLSLQQWHLQDITIQRQSCCGILVLWGLMKLCRIHS